MKTLSKNKKSETTGNIQGFRHIIKNGTVQYTATFDGADPSRIEIEHPGLWKLNSTATSAVFRFPASIMDGDPDFDENLDDDSAPEKNVCKEWAVATAEGKLPKGWVLPSSGTVEELIPAEGLTIRHRSIIREVELRQEPNCFSLQITLGTIPDDLNPDRRNWLAKLLRDANSSWRMVRFGIAQDSRSIVAEVNLTGVPHSVLRPIFQSGFSSLRWIVSGLTETVDFITRADSASEMLELLHAE